MTIRARKKPSNLPWQNAVEWLGTRFADITTQGGSCLKDKSCIRLGKVLVFAVGIIALPAKPVQGFEVQSDKTPANLRAYGEPTRITPYVDRGPKVLLSGKVQITLKIHEFSRGKNSSLMEANTYRLNNNIEKKSEFNLGNSLVIVKPLAWNRQTNDYKLQLSFSRLYGDFNQLREHIGDVTVSGKLDKISKDTFVFKGMARKKFQDAFGKPVLEAVITPSAPKFDVASGGM